MSSLEVTQLLDRLGLSHYQQRLVDNGFDSLECLYGITEHDFKALDFDPGDKRKLQLEMRRLGAQDSDGDLVSTTNSLWHGTLGTEASTTINNSESTRLLSHPDGSLVEGSHSDA
jgi:hypothetical protein